MFLIARVLVCVPLITLNLVSLILGRKWESTALGRKTAFGLSPRVHWEGRGQRISVSPRHGTGCEEIVGNVNNRSNWGRAAAACSPRNRTTWISIQEKFKCIYGFFPKWLTPIKTMHDPFISWPMKSFIPNWFQFKVKSKFTWRQLKTYSISEVSAKWKNIRVN